MKHILVITLVLVFVVEGCKQPQTSEVRVAGAMRNVMMRGDLTSTIDLDSVAKTGLYGIGPADSLQGEILLLDGKIYKSVVRPDSSIEVALVTEARAPFFVYSNVPSWFERQIPDTVQTLQQVDSFLESISKQTDKPFAFKLAGVVDEAYLHVVNVPGNKRITSPADVNGSQVSARLSKSDATLVGFFSKSHQGVFTHHNSHIHVHLITQDRSTMGHLDSLTLSRALKLYLPF
jgi:acetolactate decarboxylase